MQTLTIGKDNSSIPTWTIPISTNMHSVSLVAAGTASITVPMGATACLLAYTPSAMVLVSTKATPIPPAGAMTESNCFPNLDKIDVTNYQGSTIYFYAVNASEIYIAFYGGK